MTVYPKRDPKPTWDLIDGEWCRPSELLTATIDDPNTGEFRSSQPATAAGEVEDALKAAAVLHAQGSWAWTSAQQRIDLLNWIADGLDGRVEELGFEDALATGNPIRVATQMASYLGPRVRSATAQLREIGESTALPAEGRAVRLLRRPLGPAAVIAPWNAPTFVAVAKVASALAAGCPVILKPSEWAPAGCQIVAEVIRDAVARLDVPPAVFQLVHGGPAVGSQIVSDPRIKAVSFTGGGVGGRAVATAAAPSFTALQLELGGHNPVIIRPDADLPAAAAALAEGMTKLNGQWCEAPGKILVPRAMHDDFVACLLDELARLRVGHCLDQETDVGPLSHESHRASLQQRVDTLIAIGAKALTASSLPDLGGWFFAPTVLVGLPAAASMHELFGPAVSVHAVESVAEALLAADGPETGLAGFVFGSDLEAALDTAAHIPAGEIRINGTKLADLADGSEQTFWNASGIGGHGPTDMVRFFQGSRIIGVDDPSLPV